MEAIRIEALAELFQPVGDGRPSAAVGAEPPAFHEEIAVLRPEAVERLAGENPAVAPLRRLAEFLAPVAAVPRIPRGNSRGRKGRRGREEPPRPRAWYSVLAARRPRGTGTCRGAVDEAA